MSDRTQKQVTVKVYQCTGVLVPVKVVRNYVVIVCDFVCLVSIEFSCISNKLII